MPIYAYRCESCGHTKDVLQKLSDAVLVACPACGAPGFRKQLTAAGFQLKGSGWYVTDFKDGSKAAKAPADGAKADAAVSEPGKTGAADTKTTPAAAPAVAPASATPAAPAAAAPSSGTASGTS
jgi:putative FmdB family regulatory protein